MLPNVDDILNLKIKSTEEIVDPVTHFLLLFACFHS